MANTKIPVELSSTPGIVDNSNATAITIDSSENVGIGTGSPAAKLHIESAATNEAIRINTSTGYNAGINYYVNDTIKWTAQVLGEGTDAYRFYNFVSGEAMRIDSSGNVLVGKTSTGLANAGIEATASNILRTTKANSASAEFNRTGTDGDIAIFWKDTVPVGSIGTNGGDLYFADSSYGGIKPLGDGYAIVPCTNSGADYDNAMQLGTSGIRFKDLYLSGGAYLGGTGAANKLDDYEEGTWTPALNAGTFSAVSAQYTKVGRVVTLTVDATVGTGGGSTISNAPFTAGNTVGTGIYTSGQNFNTGKTAPTIIIGGGSTTMYFRDIGDSVTYQGMALTAGASVAFSFTYIATT